MTLGDIVYNAGGMSFDDERVPLLHIEYWTFSGDSAAELKVEVQPRTLGAPLDPASELLVSTVPSAGLTGRLEALEVEYCPALRGVLDVIYHPWPTPLAERAEAAGRVVLSGLDLLVHQARHQVRLMTGQDVPVEVLMSAVRAASDARVRS